MARNALNHSFKNACKASGVDWGSMYLNTAASRSAVGRSPSNRLSRMSSDERPSVLRQKRRSTEQNARLHAMLGDIAKQKEWAGARRDIETWKRLMTAAWLRARGEHVEMLPAIDGNGVDIVFRRTSKLSVAECSELCDFIEAWAVDNDVQLAAGLCW